MTCPVCGAAEDSAARFCGACGAQLVLPVIGTTTSLSAEVAAAALREENRWLEAFSDEDATKIRAAAHELALSIVLNTSAPDEARLAAAGLLECVDTTGIEAVVAYILENTKQAWFDRNEPMMTRMAAIGAGHLELTSESEWIRAQANSFLDALATDEVTDMRAKVVFCLVGLWNRHRYG